MADVPAPSSELLNTLKLATPARVGLGRIGQGLPTAPMLAFQLAHARAQDAVHAVLDVELIRAAVSPAETVVIQSAADTRETYLKRPDLGRRLSEHQSSLVNRAYDLVIVIADGLSANAVHAHASAVVCQIMSALSDWRIAPVVIARQARVAIGDPIAEALGATAVVVLIGERPGLSAADSLGAYLTWRPKPDCRDSDRNCVSNIRSSGGLAPERAAEKIVWLLRESKRLGFNGVALKERQDSVIAHIQTGD